MKPMTQLQFFGFFLLKSKLESVTEVPTGAAVMGVVPAPQAPQWFLPDRTPTP